MKIYFNSDNGNLKSLVSNITESQLEALLAQYARNEPKQYLEINLRNMEQADAPKSIFYPATNTGLTHKRGDLIEKVHYAYQTPHDTSKARFLRRITSAILNTYFKGDFTAVVQASPFQNGTRYIDVMNGRIAYLSHSLETKSLGEQYRVFFVPTSQWQELQEQYKGEKSWDKAVLNILIKLPLIEFQATGGNTYTQGDIDARSKFHATVVHDEEYGNLPDPRFFLAEKVDGTKGIVASDLISTNEEAETLEVLQQYLAKEYPSQSFKSFQEISKQEWLEIRSTAPFENFMH